LSSEAIWDLIDYLHAHNAGQSMRLTGKWSHPLPVPQFDAVCPDGRSLNLDDLRGRVLRIVAAPDDEQMEPKVDASTIFLVRHPATKSKSTVTGQVGGVVRPSGEWRSDAPVRL